MRLPFRPGLLQILSVLLTNSIAYANQEPRTLNILCEGEKTRETIVIGRLNQWTPSTTKESRLYIFENGRLMESDGYPDRKVWKFMRCAWDIGQISCKPPDVDNVCASAKDVIPAELSGCRSFIRINRYSGSIIEEEWLYWGNAPMGRSIVGETFRGTCQTNPTRRF
jgi:hypothetical protein